MEPEKQAKNKKLAQMTNRGASLPHLRRGEEAGVRVVPREQGRLRLLLLQEQRLLHQLLLLRRRRRCGLLHPLLVHAAGDCPPPVIRVSSGRKTPTGRRNQKKRKEKKKKKIKKRKETKRKKPLEAERGREEEGRSRAGSEGDERIFPRARRAAFSTSPPGLSKF